MDRCFTLGASAPSSPAPFFGRVSVGDGLVLSPPGRPLRVKSLRVRIGRRKRRCRGARRPGPGGITEKAEVERGMWVLAAPLHQPIRRFDAEVRYWPGSPPSGIGPRSISTWGRRCAGPPRPADRRRNCPGGLRPRPDPERARPRSPWPATGSSCAMRPPALPWPAAAFSTSFRRRERNAAPIASPSCRPWPTPTRPSPWPLPPSVSRRGRSRPLRPELQPRPGPWPPAWLTVVGGSLAPAAGGIWGKIQAALAGEHARPSTCPASNANGCAA